jgi:hypothetical protein
LRCLRDARAGRSKQSAFIDYLTGAFLIVAGVCFLLARKTRMAATYLSAWIVLLVVVIYGPVLIGALADASTAVKVEGAQLLRRHASIWRSDSFAGRAMTAMPPPSAKFTESMLPELKYLVRSLARSEIPSHFFRLHQIFF